MRLVELGKKNSKDEKQLRLAFSKIKNELNEHLDAINQNTTEIDLTNERITFLEQMIEKLTERVDELAFSSQQQEYERFEVALNLREQEVFVVLYTTNEPLSAQAIAQYLGLTDELVHLTVHQLIAHGIPVVKSSQETLVTYTLDKKFKDIQAQKQLVSINEDVLAQFNLQDDF